MVGSDRAVLLFRVEGQLCALPLANVEETMRPLGVRPVSKAPKFVPGVAVVRGEPTPVVDLGAMLFGHPTPARRWITVRLPGRRAALAVGETVGVHRLDRLSGRALPPLLHQAVDGVIEALDRLDGELLMVLRSGLALPDEVWSTLDTEDFSP